MDRNKLIKGIRLDLNIENQHSKPMEVFQNNTLRPILKFQHDLTRRLLKNHRNYNAKHLSTVTRDQYKNQLQKFIQSNVDIKNQLTGMIIGLFTNEELGFYNQNKKEINRRIHQMQLKRFVDAAFTTQ